LTQQEDGRRETGRGGGRERVRARMVCNREHLYSNFIVGFLPPPLLVLWRHYIGIGISKFATLSLTATVILVTIAHITLLVGLLILNTLELLYATHKVASIDSDRVGLAGVWMEHAGVG
jgi:hypothetical protein